MRWLIALMTMMIGFVTVSAEDTVTVGTTRPVVISTSPVAGDEKVNPTTKEIIIRFSKPMLDQSWSVGMVSKESFPVVAGKPKFDKDGRTCILPVRLQPGKTYALWLNTDQLTNFKDRDGRVAVPYLLVFSTSN